MVVYKPGPKDAPATEYLSPASADQTSKDREVASDSSDFDSEGELFSQDVKEQASKLKDEKLKRLGFDKSKFKIVPDTNFIECDGEGKVLTLAEGGKSKVYKENILINAHLHDWNSVKFMRRMDALANINNRNLGPLGTVRFIGGGNDKAVFMASDQKIEDLLGKTATNIQGSVYKVWGAQFRFIKEDIPTTTDSANNNNNQEMESLPKLETIAKYAEKYKEKSWRTNSRLLDLIHACGTVGHPNLAEAKVFGFYTKDIPGVNIIPSGTDKMLPLSFVVRSPYYPGTLGGTFFNEQARAKLVSDKSYQQALRWWLHQLLEAVGFLHSRGIGHRSIEADTVCIDRDHNVKLVNFNTAIQALGGGRAAIGRTHPCNAINYRAPEMVRDNSKVETATDGSVAAYDARQIDDFAVGALMMGLKAGQEPFQGKPPRGATASVKDRAYAIEWARKQRRHKTHDIAWDWGNSKQTTFYLGNDPEANKPDYDRELSPFQSIWAAIPTDPSSGTKNYRGGFRPIPDCQKIIDCYWNTYCTYDITGHIGKMETNYKEIAQGLCKAERELRWGIFQALNSEYFKKVEKPAAWPPLLNALDVANADGTLQEIGAPYPRLMCPSAAYRAKIGPLSEWEAGIKHRGGLDATDETSRERFKNTVTVALVDCFENPKGTIQYK